MNQRPVWVLEEGWPKLAGTTGRGGATTADRRTFEFGELKPDQTATMIWRWSRCGGNYRLEYQIRPASAPDTRAVDNSGHPSTGILPVRISDFARLTEINERARSFRSAAPSRPGSKPAAVGRDRTRSLIREVVPDRSQLGLPGRFRVRMKIMGRLTCLTAVVFPLALSSASLPAPG